MVISVHEHLCNPFSQRSLSEKIQIITDLKPRPFLCKFVTISGDAVPIKEFYERETWVTGSDHRNAFFCWACLLFPVEGFESKCFIAFVSSPDNDKALHLSLLEHKRTASHKNAVVQFQMFVAQNSIKQKTFCVKRNNDVEIKKIIDVVCSLLHQALDMIKSNSAFNYNSIFKPEACLLTLILVNCRNRSINLSEEAIKIIARYPILLWDTVKAVANVVRMTMKKEIQSSSYASLILTEHSDTDLKSTVSTVLRYICEGKVHERFVEFANFGVPKSMEIIQDYIVRVICEFEISHKCLALSCDGAVLPSNHLSRLISEHRCRYPLCFFVPCYYHDFSHILEKSLCVISECQLFFENIKAMKAFLQENSKVCVAFRSFAKGEIPDIIKLKMSNSQFMRILKLHKKQFVRFFSLIINDLNQWDKDDVTKAFEFRKILQEYQTVFFLEAFFILFDHVAILSETLGSYAPENVFRSDVLNDILEVLTLEKTNGCEKLWTVVITEIIKSCKTETLEAVSENETKHLLYIFTQTVDCVIKEIKTRFSCAESLEFLSVFNCESNGKLVLSDYQMGVLQKLQMQSLDKKQLKTELEILHKNGAVFGGKSVHEVMDILVTAELQSTFENVYKLLEVILTIPCKPATPSKKSSSKLDSINSCVAVSSRSDTKDLCLLCVEKDYLEHLKSQNDYFYDEVIQELKKLNVAVLSMF